MQLRCWNMENTKKMRLKTLDELSSLAEDLVKLDNRLQTIRSIQTRITPSYVRRESQTPGYSEDRSIDLADEAIRLKEAIAIKIVEKERRLQSAEAMIDKLDSEQRSIIMLRYVDGRSWRTILTKMANKGLSERTTFRVHREAIDRLQKLGME